MTADVALSTPDSVANDPSAVELLRVWWSNNEPAMVVKPAFQDPRAFGAVLAHAASHMAFAYQNRGAMTQDEAHMAILEGFRSTILGSKIETVVETDGKNVQ
jgi:hypothetical protein